MGRPLAGVGVVSAVEPERFFLPGPTTVAPEVLRAQQTPMFGHRSDEARALVGAVDRGLRPLFGTGEPVMIGTASATGFMEAAIRSGVRKRVLALVNGAFSGRFAEIARECGREVEVVEVPWGATIDPEVVAERLRGGGFDALTLAHSETSTGALNPVAEIAAVASEHPDLLVLVDSVSGVGGAEMAADRWGLDLVLTGAQKALAMPPGLAFAAASPRFLERAETLPHRGFYLDFVRFAKGARLNQTPTTPAVTLLAAAHLQLQRIEAETVAGRWQRHTEMAATCHRRVEALHDEGIAVEVVAPLGGRSPTVTCIRIPEGRSVEKLEAGMLHRGFVIGKGYGLLKDDTVRIGHMGEHTLPALEAVMDAFADELRDPVHG